ncbi:MAG: hypothetical protein DI587_03260 [Variovorax paradoxus]|nr:MAG: hypothetical protein DI583_03260 [Variovorax paradoxus]PZQ15718.1 MAG: hypothetical protein DI587_03260 [Variovorax paradoxus]
MPDTISNLRAQLLQPYVRAASAEAKISSAYALVKLALADTKMLPAHRKHLLKTAQWWVTEADGKWKTRFRSMEVLRLAKEDPTSDVRINHEHVYGRAELAELMLLDHTQVEAILELCVGCIVTVDEHRRLTAQKHVHGWKRYRAANVRVADMTQPGGPLVEWPN